jgi:hypothetical protein
MIFDASMSTDPEGNSLSYRWSSSSPDITFNNASNANASASLPKSNGPGSYEIRLNVTDGKNESSVTRVISFPALTPQREYGLGIQVLKETSNSESYEWYMDQANTGPHSLVNCGPTSVTMAIKWAKEDFTLTPVHARSKYRSSGGWWYTNDIINYLSDNYVANWTIPLDGNFPSIKTQIDKGNIVILCLDMHSIPYNPEARYRVDKFYETDNAGWGHFIVIKGYKEIDGLTYYEAYDPYSFSKTYDDGTLKGRNRYYRSSSLKIAVEIWWNYAIVVSKESAPIGGRRGINTEEIIHMPGR